MAANWRGEEERDEELQAGLTPEQRSTLMQSLAERYKMAGDDTEVKAAEKRARFERMGAGLGDAFAEYAMAGSGVAPVKFGDQLRESAANRVAQAKTARDERMQNVLKEDQLNRMESDRSFQDKERGRKELDWKQEDDTKKREDDPNSQESQMARDLAKRMMPSKNFDGMTATQLKRGLPTLEKIYSVEQQRLGRVEAREERNAARADARADRELQRERIQAEKEAERSRKEQEKADKLSTPYGRANTEQDAKDLKDAHIIKRDFDSKIQEMIDLRTKYGAEVANREAVERGQQLSKDLLLAYKDMAKLGVLSKADQDIIEAVIPKDPLEFKFASLVGQDPIMVKLKKFKEDSDRNFNERVKVRIKGGSADRGGAEAPKQPVGGMHGNDLP